MDHLLEIEKRPQLREAKDFMKVGRRKKEKLKKKERS